MAAKHHLAQAIDAGLQLTERRHRLRAVVNESMGLVVSCVGVAVMLIVFIPGLFSGGLAWILVGGVLLVEQHALLALVIANRGYVLQTGEIVRQDNAVHLQNTAIVQQA